MMKILPTTVLTIMVIGVLAHQSIFVVNERDQAAVVRFGRVIDVETDPGLYFKLPFSFIGADRVRQFEDRALRLDLSDIRLQVSGGKFYRVNAFVVYKIEDPERFLEKVSGDIEIGESRLLTRLDAALREVYGLHGFEAALSIERRSMMEQVAAQLQPAANDLGMEIVDVRIERTDLTEPVLQKAYDRMKAERLAVAERIKARGRESALRIRAATDRSVVEILSKARRQAQILRGEGDAESTRIYANAHSRAPEFYAFYRSMKAYEQALNPETTTMILSLDSEFFRHFRGNIGDNSGPVKNTVTADAGKVSTQGG
jgi:membrane protease subunit HflC